MEQVYQKNKVMNNNQTSEIHPYKSDNGKWGYMVGDKILIEPAYNCAMPYHDNLCWVKHIGWGAIDLKNNHIIPLIYKSVKRISKYRYLVKSFDNKYGLLDNEGKKIIKLKYDFISVIGENRLKLQYKNNVEWLDFNGIQLYQDLEIGLILNIKCHDFFDEIWTSDKTIFFHNNGNVVVIEENTDRKYEYFCSNEKYIVVYDWYGIDESMGLLVYTWEGNKALERKRVEGNIQICNDTLIIECDDNTYILINLITEQERKIENIKDLFVLNQNYIGVVTADVSENFGILNSIGDTVIPCVYCGLGTGFFNEFVYGDNYVAASKDGKLCGIIDMSQNNVVPIKYKKIINSGISGCNSFIVLKDSLWGVVTINDYIIVDFKYQTINVFINNLSVAILNGKYGVINEHDEVVIPFIYDYVEDLHNGNFITINDGCFYVIDIYSNIIINKAYGLIESCYSNNVLKVYKGNLWGFVDVYGDEIVPCSFRTDEDNNITIIKDGMRLPCIVDEDKEGDYLIDIERLKRVNNYFHLKDLSEQSFQDLKNELKEYLAANHLDEFDYYYDDDFDSDDIDTDDDIDNETFDDILFNFIVDNNEILVEYKGYFIYLMFVKVDYKMREPRACVINPKGNIIFNSHNHDMMFTDYSDNTIRIKYDYYHVSEYNTLCIDTINQDIIIEEILIPVENSSLIILKKDEKYCLLNSEHETILPIQYNIIQIVGNVVYVQSDNYCQLLVYRQGSLEEKEKVGFGERSDIKHIYSLKQITPNHIRFCRNYYRESGIDMILDNEGNTLFYQIEQLTKYDNVYIVCINNGLNHSLFNDADSYPYLDEYSQYRQYSLYDLSLLPIIPGEYFDSIIYCKSGYFIAKRGTLHNVFDDYGNKLFSTDSYTDMREFYENLSVVSQNGSYGVVDIHGNEIIPCIYSEISDFNNGIAIAQNYGTKIEIYKDGSMQKMLQGKLHSSIHTDYIFCEIVNNHFQFTQEKDGIIVDFLKDNTNELIVIAYENEQYTIVEDNSYKNDRGKFFLVDKTGLILKWFDGIKFIRLSKGIILYGIDSLHMQSISSKRLNEISEVYASQKITFFTSNGSEASYLSSFNESIHFIMKDERCIIIDKNGNELWSSMHGMCIFSTGDGTFKIYSFSEYEEEKNEDEDDYYRDEYKTLIEVWDSKSGTSKTTIVSCSSVINTNDVKFSSDGKYIVIPISKEVGYSYSREELYLLVLNENNEITINEDFGYTRVESILKDKILLAHYDLEMEQSWNYHTQEYDYYDRTVHDGYTLLSLLDGQRLGKGNNSQYIILKFPFREYNPYEDNKDNLRFGIYDIVNDKEIVPVIYIQCNILKCKYESYIIVKGEDEKLGLYYGPQKILDCKYENISPLVIYAIDEDNYNLPKKITGTNYFIIDDGEGKKGVYYDGDIRYEFPLKKQRTEYIIFDDGEGKKGVIYDGDIISNLDFCKIKGLKVISSDRLQNSSNYIAVSRDGNMEIFHGKKSCGIYDECVIYIVKQENDKNYLKLKKGEQEGLIEDNGCIIPLDFHKIWIDSLGNDDDWHICVSGDKVYYKDGATIYLGSDDERLIAVYCSYKKCYCFIANDQVYKFYGKYQGTLNYKDEEHQELGKIAVIDSISEVVFSYSKKRFIKSPYYEEKEEFDEPYNDYEPEINWERETYYALGGDDYDRWRENGGNLDDMMDGMGF